ncbi:putative endo-1,4-beta-glucanase [Xylariaceae sp. FL0016]|nr:putative endo-1,4-beta-glucanase [Xylariaceae sp. FL0016]
MRSFTSALLAALAGATHVTAHSFVSNINIDRLSYNGFHPPTPNSDPLAVGWSTTAFDQGYVNQTGYQTPDIICHRGAANAKAHARVAAGDTIHIQWNGWPQSHKGPVIDYLASCGDAGCEAVDKNALRLFKISEAGLIDGAEAPGTWATDQLIANNNSWVVEVPPQLRPGFYVLRTEIIALHNASHAIGAQNYPQCVNLQVEGGGTVLPSGGLPGQALYDPDDESMHLDIYAGVSTYRIPGPTVIAAAAAETVALSHPVPTGTGTVYTGTAASTASATSTAVSRARRQKRDMRA